MKHLVYLFLAFALAGSVSAAQKGLQVEASKGLRVSVVAGSKQQSLAPAFGDALKKVLHASGQDMNVAVKTVGGDAAAFQLESGSTDAVVVFGRLPRSLMTSGLFRMEANLPSNDKATVYLVYKDGDPALRQLLDALFPKAINEDALLSAIHVAFAK